MSVDNKSLFGHTALGVKLKEALLKSEVKIKKNYRKNYISHRLPDLPAIDTIGEDGQDHICLSISGKTDLGRALSPDITLTFDHKLLGQFVSIQAFWTWVRSEKRPDSVRFMSSKELHKFQHNETNFIDYNLHNYKAIVMDACWQMIQSMPEIKEEIIKSTQPFDMHYVDKTTKERKRPNYSIWYLYGMEEIRTTLKEDENKRPAFKMLMNKEIRDLDVYISEVFGITEPIKYEGP